jgi:hypothetical protein
MRSCEPIGIENLIAIGQQDSLRYIVRACLCRDTGAERRTWSGSTALAQDVCTVENTSFGPAVCSNDSKERIPSDRTIAS